VLPSLRSVPSFAAAACAFASAIPLLAQDAVHPGGADPTALPVLRAPIRTAAPEPIGAATADATAWAAGPDYKVGFAAGRVAFHPVLGPTAPRSLPVTWTTTEVIAGGMPLLAPAPAAQESFGDWRLERRIPGVMTEAWNVREDGVEQTFVFGAPLGNGDLIVRGRLDSELDAAPIQPARHADIEFRDASGRVVVRYGAARAFDAAGRWLDMETAFDGREVELRVPARWLAGATWPVTIDPLLSANTIVTGSQTVGAVRIAVDDESREFLIGVTRAVSASDHDAYVYVSSDTLGAGTLILADQSSAYDTRVAASAYAGGADAWVIALERQARGLGRPMLGYQVRARRDHRRNDALVEIQLPADSWPREIDLGGSASFGGGTHALMVFQSDRSRSNTDLSEVMAVVIDVRNRTHTQPFVVSPQGSSSFVNVDRERPSVQRESEGAYEGWIVAWQEIGNHSAADDWDLHAVRVLPNGNRGVQSWLGVADDRAHGLRPRLAGRGGEYLLAFGEVVNQGPRPVSADAPILRVQRFQWRTSQTTPVRGPVRTLAVGAPAYQALDLAFDTRTGSHWCVAWRDSNQELWLSRIGHDGLVAESGHLTAGTPRGNTAGLVYDLSARNFVAAYATDEAQLPVRARRLTYPTTANVLLYGIGCGGEGVVIDPPYAGHGTFTFGMNGLPARATAFVLVGQTAADLPLDPLGMTGCHLLVDASSALVSLPVAVNGFGQARPQLPLPSTLRADLRAQLVWLAPGTNPAGILSGTGFRVRVR
jgi:hypothetical protein